MDVSVIIPTRNRCHLLARALPPLLADPAVREVLVCDDGSTDHTPAFVAEKAASDARIRLLRDKQAGVLAALQRGLQAASGDAVLWIDDDVEPAPRLATGHAAHHSRRPGLVVVGYMPLTPARTAAARIYAESYERVCCQWEANPDAILRDLWGGNVSLRRIDACRVGFTSPGWSPTWRHVDRDFGLRCLRAGLSGLFDRSLLATHHYRRDTAAMLAEARAKAAALVHLHRRHGDLIGPFIPEKLLAAPTRTRRMVLRLSIPRTSYRVVHAALLLAARGAHRVGRPNAEVTFLRLLHRSAVAHHAIRECRALAAERPQC